MMGHIENVNQELESNITERPKAPESLAENPKCEHLTSENNKRDCVTLATDSEQKEASRAQDVEKELCSTGERLERVAEVESRNGQITENLGVEKLELELKCFKAPPVSDNREVALQKGPTDANVLIPFGATSVNSGNASLQADKVGDSNHLYREDIISSGKLRTTNTKLKVPVTSSWTLRSKSREKTKALELDDNGKEGNSTDEKKRRGRKPMQTKKSTHNEFSRTRNHLRYLLNRIKYEQYMIDAYSAEGWKGQSLEKLKPEKELERAKSHIVRYKLKIRALFQHLDQLLLVGKLPASLFDSQGEIDSEDIFCAKCGSKDLTLDNDIILCDGACERGFHQFCLEPPLLKEDIPPGDEGWLCPGCECKADCIDILKDFQGTKITINDSWEKIFPEAAAVASGNKLIDGSGSGSASDDSEDDDYDPEKPDVDEKIKEDDNEKVEEDESTYDDRSDESSYSSSSDDLAPPRNDNKYLEGSSDDSEDGDFDPLSVDQDKQVKEDGLSSDFTSDSEDFGALLQDDTTPDADSGRILTPSNQEYPSTASKEGNHKVGRMEKQTLKDELSYLMESGSGPVSGRRQVQRLDYKMLNDETYGNSTSDSSDEDFGETTAPKRRRTNCGKAVAPSPIKTPITNSMANTSDGTSNENKHLSKRTRRSISDGVENESPNDGSSSAVPTKSASRRLGEVATQDMAIPDILKTDVRDSMLPLMRINTPPELRKKI
ncbi:pathogenesis-related homeodomain protein isoform X2 [Andrographis paniculata]|uniref:pathogenesis-related homeodomain protein isoform X2 n=1 Tax=Andrographis paniculata TaxID=175694 RepID=UPI0021E85EE8|nr:pathogenesis-related homeodomain protein isoform X2 [Andrographis paniculata]